MNILKIPEPMSIYVISHHGRKIEVLMHTVELDTVTLILGYEV